MPLDNNVYGCVTPDIDMEAETASEVEAEEVAASHVLANALKDIDGLIDRVVEKSCSPDPLEITTEARLIKSANDLRVAIEDSQRERQSDVQISSDTLQVIYQWVSALVEVRSA